MKAVIIEDENLIAKELQYKINSLSMNVDIVQVLPSLKTARKWLLENAEPDLVFADIQLSDGVSFEIFEQFDLDCPVIFTTAYDEYAIRAFKVNGIDYLLKPVDIDELKRAIEKAQTIIDSKTMYPKNIRNMLQLIAQPGGMPHAYREKFIVKQRNQWIPVYIKDIACFYRENLNYIITFTGEKYIVDFVTLEEIEELVDPNIYYRANRQSLVHINAIQSIRPMENQKLILTLKTPIKMEQDVSREKAPSFKRWFER